LFGVCIAIRNAERVVARAGIAGRGAVAAAQTLVGQNKEYGHALGTIATREDGVTGARAIALPGARTADILSPRRLDRSETLSHPKYRPDIDGLRAVAVGAVVGYHAFALSGFRWFTGGYVGVDVFFVISGYLISTIIFENLSSHTFSFGEFYARRVRRIFPALLVVLTATLSLGWFCLFPFEYWRLAEQAAASAVFVANDLFASGAGYLSDGVASAPLIHLWSLGVEEQFYILWPVLIWLIFKMRLSFVWLPLTVGIASIAFGIVKFRSEPLAAFCLTQTRAWELSLGSIAAALPFSDKRIFAACRDFIDRAGPSNLSAAGLALIALSILFYSRHEQPEALLVPAVGAFLIILAGKARVV
jgi:peptidoglycan/LPS O-acetylase OafA/YrhL